MSDRKEYFENYQEKRKRVNVSFSLEEFQHIQELSAVMNTKPSTLVRKLTLAALDGKVLQSPAMEEEVRGLSFLLRNIASNLNQIARHSNRVKHVIDENSTLEQLRILESSLHEAYKRAKG